MQPFTYNYSRLQHYRHSLLCNGMILYAKNHFVLPLLLQTDRSPEVNEVSSILAELESNPSRAEALLLGEDRLRRSNHDCLARLALAIEPDGRQPTQDRHHRILDSETELEQLRDRVERLQDSSKDLYEEITQLRRDFMVSITYNTFIPRTGADLCQ